MTPPLPERLRELAERLRELAERLPVEARFNVGTYDDGSGPVAKVSYDASTGTADRIWVRMSSDQWIAFDWRYADEIADTIKACAAILRARAQSPLGDRE